MGPSSLQKLDFESIKDMYTFSNQFTMLMLLGQTIGTKLFRKYIIQKTNL